MTGGDKLARNDITLTLVKRRRCKQFKAVYYYTCKLSAKRKNKARCKQDKARADISTRMTKLVKRRRCEQFKAFY